MSKSSFHLFRGLPLGLYYTIIHLYTIHLNTNGCICLPDNGRHLFERLQELCEAVLWSVDGDMFLEEVFIVMGQVNTMMSGQEAAHIEEFTMTKQHL